MPDRRRHRGPHPADVQLFSVEQLSRLRQAVRDLSWLLTQGYAHTAALKLVGDRFELVDRQRTAVMRCACSDQSRQERQQRRVGAGDLRGRAMAIDGFNLVTTIEVALSQGVLIQGRDGCIRDMAGMHGTYRKVEETVPALELIGKRLEHHQVGHVLWLLDRPVSNSGRLSKIMECVAAEHRWNWSTELHHNPDQQLIDIRGRVVVSADGAVIQKSEHWWPLANDVVEALTHAAWLLNLG